MDDDSLAALPRAAFTRGLSTLKRSKYVHGTAILGFDCEYDSSTQEIVCYQLSDGKHSELLVREADLTLPELSEWAIKFVGKYVRQVRDISSILLVSHYTPAELGHVARFWVDGEVRRVSPQQVFNVTYKVTERLRVVVYDLYHFFNASLANVAKTFGFKKLDYDTAHVSRQSLLDPKFKVYAVNDAVLCANIFTAFRERVWREYGVDVIRYCTPASLAMAVYRRHWLKTDLPAPPRLVRELAWRCLWGGRSEAYSRGDFSGSWKLRDVVGLYPRCAELVGMLPTAQAWVKRVRPSSWRGLCHVGFAYPAGTRFPALPVFVAGKLVFPLKGTSWCTLDEAKAASDAGALLVFKTVYEYLGGDDSLAAYMRFFAAEKLKAQEAGDKVGRELSKLLMNALIGKLSQHKGDVDVEDAKKAADQIGVPLEVVLDPSFHHPLKPVARPRVGGNVMPEWSALVLGRARAVMGVLIPVTVPDVTSTDSLLVDLEHDALVDDVARGLGVALSDKNENSVNKETGLRAWCQDCGPVCAVVRVRILRTRVYGGLCPHGNVVWSATHALHLPKRGNVASAFLMGDSLKYSKRVRAGLKTAIRSGVKFQSEKMMPMQFGRGWDDKRELLRGGSTRPWSSTWAARAALEGK